MRPGVPLVGGARAHQAPEGERVPEACGPAGGRIHGEDTPGGRVREGATPLPAQQQEVQLCCHCKWHLLSLVGCSNMVCQCLLVLTV